MARKIHSRLKISGTLEAQTPLHVGGFGDSADTDLPLAQNGKGEWYVPGTSITGVLRSWCEKNFRESNDDAKEIIKDLFAPKRKPGVEEGHASFVLLEDATIEDADKVLPEIRDGVGIDRFYGVAADKAKFDRAVLPRGTKLNFVMTVEIGARKDPDKNAKNDKEKKGESKEEFKTREKETKAVIGNLLAALTESKVRFGAARTRGLGRMRLTGKKQENGEYENEPEIKEQSFIGFDNILNLLNGHGEIRTITDLKNAINLSTNSAARLEINITWKPRLPVMVKTGYDGIGVDMLPLTSGVKNGELALCLPGSSIKGAMRSHAERIIRTILNFPVKKDFHEQIEVPLVEDLFGARSKRDNTKGLGGLAIDDCYAKEHLNTKQWREVEVARDAKKKENEQDKADEVSYYQRELWQRLREIDEAIGALSDEQYKHDTRRFRIHHHVAIDRWTGGASEGALYSVLAPTNVEWEEMRLMLDFDRLKGVELPTLMLLLLTLRDVAENRLPLGFATNRGMGEIVVEKIMIEGQGLSDELKELAKFETSGKFAELSTDIKDRLKKEWGEWRKNNQQS